MGHLLLLFGIYTSELAFRYQQPHHSCLFESLYYLHLGQKLSYNAIDTDDDDDEETNDNVKATVWKLVHADVFHPPNMSMTYCAFIGSGVQIAISILCTMCLVAIGCIDKSRDTNSMVKWMLFLYIICGTLAGYTSSRLYKGFRGRSLRACTLVTATVFPGTILSVLLFCNTCSSTLLTLYRT